MTIRVMINDASSHPLTRSYKTDESRFQRTRFLMTDAIHGFVTQMLIKPLCDAGKKWIKALFDKSMRAYLRDPQHVGLVAMTTLTFVTAYIAGSESASSDELFESWKLNILPVCQAIGVRNQEGVYEKDMCSYRRHDSSSLSSTR